MPAVLVVDDEPLQRDILKTILSDEGYETCLASSGEEALKTAKVFNPDVILTDLMLEGIDGIEFMKKIKAGESSPEVIIMTAFATVETAVDAMKRGAFDYIKKPLDKDDVILTIKRAAEKIELLRKNRELQQALSDKFSFKGIIGDSMAIKDIISIAKKISPSTATVLVLGESGTGKELVAKAIHYDSPRSTKSFIAINCSAIPETLLESELFGYEPGSFTGAAARKTGLFEAANGGTLLLDEIGDIPLLTQSKLLRVLQEKEVRRIGGREAIKVDVRIIAATNKDLEKEIKNGRFREDLYYRLRVVVLELPPLRERKADIKGLARYFISRYNSEFGKRISGIDISALNALSEYHWPGNIRQLESVIERAVLMSDSETIKTKDIMSELRLSHQQDIFDITIPEEGMNLEELEKELLRKAMAKANNVAAGAARLLGMSYKTFWYRWEKLNAGIPSPKEEEAP